MIRILDKNKNPLCLFEDYEDFQIERKLDMDEKVLSFTANLFSIEGVIELEGYIETKDDRFVVKEINKSTKGKAKVVAQLDVEDLEGKTFLSFESTTATIASALSLAFVGTGWTVGVCNVTKKRTLRLTHTDAYKIMKSAASTYRIEYVFHTRDQVVDIYEERGSDRGVYFTDELNLNSLTVVSQSYDFYTELQAFGSDGMTFADINGGKDYVENHTYSDKVKRFIWKDERYTVKQSLLEDATAKLNDMATPYISYDVSILDLAKASDKYSILDYSIGDTVTIIDSTTNTKVQQRVVAITEHPDEPSKNTLTIANLTLTFDELSQKYDDTADTVDNITSDNGTVNGNTIDSIETNQINNLEQTVTQYGIFDTINTNYLTVSGRVTAVEANVGTLTANVGSFEQLTTQNFAAVNADIASIRTTDLVAMNAAITNLQTGYLDVTGRLTADEASITSLDAREASFESATATHLSAIDGDITYLKSEAIVAIEADIHDIRADYVEVSGNISAHAAAIDNLTAAQASFETATAQNFSAVNGSITNLRTVDLAATNANVANLSTNLANVNTLLAGNAGTGQLSTIVLNASNASIDNALIKSLVSQNITVNDLLSGNISTTKFTVGSDSGKFKIEDNTLTIKDASNHVRVQIGEDGSGDYSIIVYDSTGTGQLFNANGITESGISDGLIKDAKIASNANIQASKLDIASLFTAINADGSHTINSSRIWLDEDDQSLNAKFSSIGSTITTISNQSSQASTDAANAVTTSQRALEVLSGISTLDALGISLSNDADVVHTYSDGTGGDYSACYTRVYVWMGDNDVSAQSTFVVTPSSGVTGTWNSSTKTYKVDAMSTDNGYVDFDGLYGTGERYLLGPSYKLYTTAGGSILTIPSGGTHITKRFSISKAPDGRIGVSYDLRASSAVLTRRVSEQTITFLPASVTFSAYKNVDGVVSEESCFFKIEETSDFSTWTTKYQSQTAESTHAYTPSQTATLRGVACTITDENNDTLDYQTIFVVADADGLEEDISAVDAAVQLAQAAIATTNTHVANLETSTEGLSQSIDDIDTSLSGVIAGNLLYQFTYVNNGTNTNLTAHVYRLDVDSGRNTEITSSYPESCFWWSKKSEDYDDVEFARGKTATIANANLGLDGNVDGWFYPYYQKVITTRNNAWLISNGGKVYTVNGY